MIITVESHEELEDKISACNFDTYTIWLYKSNVGSATIQSKRSYTTKAGAIKAAKNFRDKYLPDADIEIKEIM